MPWNHLAAPQLAFRNPNNKRFRWFTAFPTTSMNEEGKITLFHNLRFKKTKTKYTKPIWLIVNERNQPKKTISNRLETLSPYHSSCKWKDTTFFLFQFWQFISETHNPCHVKGKMKNVETQTSCISPHFYQTIKRNPAILKYLILN